MNSRDAQTPIQDEVALEKKIQEKGLTAPRITPERIDEQIAETHYMRGPNTLTICVLVLKNGFSVTGESACVDPKNFDEEIGKEIAFRNARDKIWSLEGYALAKTLNEPLYDAVQVVTPFDIARVCHEANRAYCAALGDHSQPSWKDAPDWQKKSAITGVNYHWDNPNSTPADSHKSWLAEKEADGWKFGPVKDPEKKEHPCFVPYEELPAEQKAKDYIFLAICRAMKEI
jgi:hypothetical protein